MLYRAMSALTASCGCACLYAVSVFGRSGIGEVDLVSSCGRPRDLRFLVVGTGVSGSDGAIGGSWKPTVLCVVAVAIFGGHFVFDSMPGRVGDIPGQCLCLGPGERLFAKVRLVRVETEVPSTLKPRCGHLERHR